MSQITISKERLDKVVNAVANGREQLLTNPEVFREGAFKDYLDVSQELLNSGVFKGELVVPILISLAAVSFEAGYEYWKDEETTAKGVGA